MADNLSPDNKPVDQPITTPPAPDKKAILETPPQGTPIPQIATPPVATTPPAAPVPDKRAILETPPQGTPIPQIATPPAAETISNKSTVGATATPPTPASVQVEPPAFAVPASAAALPDVENPYLLDGEIDRARLVAQARLFRGYIEKHAKEFVGENLKRILDAGCSEGRITQVFARLYPEAQVIGIDKDEKAIEQARIAAKGIPNLTFEVWDVTQGLPAGPFDLVYESLMFQHLHNIPQVIKAAYDVLKPGGYLWMKDLDIHLDKFVDHPAYHRLAGWVVAVMDMVGQDWRITADLAPVLRSIGLNLLRSEKEFYTMGNMDTPGRLAMANHLGAYLNGRKAYTRFLKVPEGEVEKTYKEIVDAMMAPGGPVGDFKYVNTVVQRPVQPVVVTPPVETPAVAMPESAAALPDIENPYVLSGEVDRARQVVQLRLFRNYIEKNAKQFVGENIKSILDLGCGEGQITQVFARLYPDAQVIGIDKDEKAIDAAQRAARGIQNLKFEVRDILQGLPAGPFDLVYESIVFQHLPSTVQPLKAVYDVLKPGGYLWMKDVALNVFGTAIDHPAYARLTGWVIAMMDKFGLQWKVAANPAPVLNSTGFTVLRSEKEVYAMGNQNTEGRISMSVTIGGFYNARKAMAKVVQIPESEIEQTYKEIVTAMMAPNGPYGVCDFINTIAQRSETDEKANIPAATVAPVDTAPILPATPVATPATVAAPVPAISVDTPATGTVAITAPTPATPVTDIENPYILGDAMDRARLVAQAKLLSDYVQTHAREFIQTNVRSILEIGCGQGQMTRLFAKMYPDAQVVGVDRDPAAIDVAKHDSTNSRNLRFEAMDAQKQLPDGPFDLIYASAVFLHMHTPEAVMKRCFEILAPGGYLWIKEADLDGSVSVIHPILKQLNDMVYSTLEANGGHPRIYKDVMQLMEKTGFSDVQKYEEIYDFGSKTSEGRLIQSVTLQLFHNAKPYISKVKGVSEDTLGQLYLKACEIVMGSNPPMGTFLALNFVARKPQ